MIIGIDYSITSPAVCLYNPRIEAYIICYRDKNVIPNQDSNANLMIGENNVTLLGMKEESKARGPGRYMELAAWTADCCSITDAETPDQTPELIVFEGISYGSPGQVSQLSQNMGAAKAILWNYGYQTIIDVAPTSVKKFATGHGFAQKIDMVRKFEEETGIDFSVLFPGKDIEKSPINDIVDSYWICRYAINNKEELINSLDSNGCQTKPKKKRKKRKAKSDSV